MNSISDSIGGGNAVFQAIDFFILLSVSLG